MLLVDVNILRIWSLWHRLLLLHILVEDIWSHLEQEVVVSIKVFFVNFAYLPVMLLLLLIAILTLDIEGVSSDTPTIQEHGRRIQVIIVSGIRVIRLGDWRTILRWHHLIIVGLKEVLINN